MGEETTYELAKIGEPIIPGGNFMALGYSPGWTENWESCRPGSATTVARDWPTIIFPLFCGDFLFFSPSTISNRKEEWFVVKFRRRQPYGSTGEIDVSECI